VSEKRAAPGSEQVKKLSARDLGRICGGLTR
jgi:hypothetical protein